MHTFIYPAQNFHRSIVSTNTHQTHGGGDSVRMCAQQRITLQHRQQFHFSSQIEIQVAPHYTVDVFSQLSFYSMAYMLSITYSYTTTYMLHR